MKIYVNARFLTQPVSGVQRYGIECSRQIKKLCPDAVFLAPKNVLHKDIADELGATIIGRNTGHLWEQIDLPFYLFSKKKAPLLNLANTGPLLYGYNFLTIHDLAFYHHPEWNSKAFSAWYNILIPRLAHKSLHIFTVSQTIRNEIIQSYRVPANKISVTGNGIAQKMLNEWPLKDIPKEKIILSVGSFSKRKNHQHLVNAFLDSPLKEDYRLIIIGDKHKVFSESNLNEDVITNNNIEIYQDIGEEELISMYSKAEIVVSLSAYEGFGIPLLEALYYDCKIVCSDIPVYHEIYDGYAFFCDPLNISSVTKAFAIAAAAPANADIIPLLDKYNYMRAAQAILAQIMNSKL